MKRVALILAMALLSAAFCSCSLIKNAVGGAKQAIHQAVLDSTDQKAMEKAAPEGGNGFGTWPDEIPADVPVFRYGKCMQDETCRFDSDSSVSYGMRFTGVGKKDVVAYGKELKAAGLDVSTTESSSSYSISGSLYRDGNFVYTISLYWDSSYDSCSYTIMLYKE